MMSLILIKYVQVKPSMNDNFSSLSTEDPRKSIYYVGGLFHDEVDTLLLFHLH